jgi:radical SAM superfamily enzyme YgiQ (UPF0313 family)
MRRFNGKMLVTGLSIPEILQRIPPSTHLIGVSCMFSHEWPYTRQIIQAIKKAFPSVPIVAGGEHITALPDFTLQTCPEVEYCVLGEGEETLVEVVEYLKTPEKMTEVAGLALRHKGQILHTQPRKRIKTIDDIPWPAWELVPLETYLSQGLSYGVNLGRTIPMIATRGCPYECTFCSNPTMWTTRWIARKPDLVLDEIEYYLKTYQVTNIDFYDLTAIIRKDWIKEFCWLILDRGLKFTWQLPSGTRSEAIDEEVCRLLYASGCRNVSYAPESGSREVLRRIKKKVKLDRMLTSMRGAVRSGLNVKANIIFGFPDETRWEVWQTIGFLFMMALTGVHDVSISMFSPYPGSELFSELLEQGKIKAFSDEYFLSLTAYTDMARAVSWTDNMSSKELNFLRMFGLLGFYGTQYLLRPWRLIQTLRNLISNRQESRLDKTLQDYIRRFFKSQVAEVELDSGNS